MIKNFINKRLKKSNNERGRRNREAKENLTKILKKDWDIKLELTEIERDGYTFKLGDKVICRSNEPNPLVIGEIVEFWDNDGKWTNCIPYIKDENGKLWGCMGIIRPYSEKLMTELKHLRPLEQWNYFVDEPYK